MFHLGTREAALRISTSSTQSVYPFITPSFSTGARHNFSTGSSVWGPFVFNKFQNFIYVESNLHNSCRLNQSADCVTILQTYCVLCIPKHSPYESHSDEFEGKCRTKSKTKELQRNKKESNSVYVYVWMCVGVHALYLHIFVSNVLSIQTI